MIETGAARPHDRRAGRVAFRILIVGAALAIAARIIPLNLADHAVRTRDNLALLVVTAPVSAKAAARVAEARLASGDAAGAETLARQSLAMVPYSPAALRTLGLALQAKGAMEEAGEAMVLSGALGWRDTPTQLWLIGAYLQQKDYATALERADALARRAQETEAMMRLFHSAALDPAAQAVLIGRLQEEPGWRRAFFEAAEQLPPAQHGVYAGFLATFAGGGTLRPEEVAPFVRALYRNGDYAAASRLWRRFGAHGIAEPGNGVVDGGFSRARLESTRRPSPFEWAFRQPPGSGTYFEAPPWDESGRALHAVSPGNARLEIARQTIALAPGRHALSYDLAPATDRNGHAWIVICLPRGPELMLGPPRSQPREGAAHISRSFQIPSPGCPAQELRLVLRSGATGPLDLWFDNVLIAREHG